MKATYNKSKIMQTAWFIFRNNTENLTFGESLKKSWNIAKNNIKDINIDAIYKKYYNQVYYYVFARVGNKAEIAEEIVNDTFIQANRHLHNYDVNKAKLNTWLITIAHRLVIDNYRKFSDKNSQKVNVSQFTDDSGKEFFEFKDTATINTMENQELGEHINKALSKLNPRNKQVLTMFLIDELSHNEIVEQLNISLTLVKQIIFRGRKKLMEELETVKQEY